MEFSVQIEGLDKTKALMGAVRQNIAKEINKALYVSGKKIETEMKASIQGGHKTGKIYKRGSKGAVQHRASAPGEAPATDTGRLVNAIRSQMENNGSVAKVWVPDGFVKYAKFLEWGTKHISPRPFFVPAIEKSKGWIRNRLQVAFRRGMEGKSS